MGKGSRVQSSVSQTYVSSRKLRCSASAGAFPNSTCGCPTCIRGQRQIPTKQRIIGENGCPTDMPNVEVWVPKLYARIPSSTFWFKTTICAQVHLKNEHISSGKFAFPVALPNICVWVHKLHLRVKRLGLQSRSRSTPFSGRFHRGATSSIRRNTSQPDQACTSFLLMPGTLFFIEEFSMSRRHHNSLSQ